MKSARINGRNISYKWLKKNPGYRTEQEQLAAVKRAAREDKTHITDKQALKIVRALKP